MTGNQRSDRAMPELLGNPAGSACVTKDNGVPAQGTKGQIRAWLPVRASGYSGDWLPIVGQIVRMARPQEIRGHSMPIARMAGEAV
jgi:hypothetical protein